MPSFPHSLSVLHLHFVFVIMVGLRINLNETARVIKSCVVYFVLLDYFQNEFKLLILSLSMIAIEFPLTIWKCFVLSLFICI